MTIQALKITIKEPNLEHLKSPYWSVYSDVIIFLFNGIIKQNIYRVRLPVSNIWNDRLPQIIAPYWGKKRNNCPGCYLRKYSILVSFGSFWPDTDQKAVWLASNGICQQILFWGGEGIKYQTKRDCSLWQRPVFLQYYL